MRKIKNYISKLCLLAESNEKILPLGLFLILYLFFLTFSLIHGPFLVGDEPEYHLPHIDIFLREGLFFFWGKSYNTSNTPLTYIVVGVITYITKAPLVTARIITAFFSFFSLLIAVKLTLKPSELVSSKQKSLGGIQDIYARYALIFFYPYFFLFSFLFYAMFLGVLTALLAVNYILQPKSVKNYLLASLFLTLAVLSQQFYLVLIPVFLVKILTGYAGVNNDATNKSVTSILKSIKREHFSDAVLFLIPFLIPSLIFIHWGGMRTPNFNQHHIKFVPSNLTAILFVFGFTFLPIAIKSIIRFSHKKILLIMSVSIVLVLFNSPDYANSYNSNQFAGLTHRAIYYFNAISPMAYKVVMLFFVATGIAFTTNLITESLEKKEYFYLSIVVLFLLLIHFFQPSAQRHTIPLILFATILFIRVIGARKQLQTIVWLILQSLTYFIYTFTLKGLSS